MLSYSSKLTAESRSGGLKPGLGHFPPLWALVVLRDGIQSKPGQFRVRSSSILSHQSAQTSRSENKRRLGLEAEFLCSCEFDLDVCFSQRRRKRFSRSIFGEWVTDRLWVQFLHVCDFDHIKTWPVCNCSAPSPFYPPGSGPSNPPFRVQMTPVQVGIYKTFVMLKVKIRFFLVTF